MMIAISRDFEKEKSPFTLGWINLNYKQLHKHCNRGQWLWLSWKAVASDSRGLRFESSHQQKFMLYIFCQLYWKDKKKRKKRLGIAHFYNTATVKAPWFRIKLIVEINFDCCWNEKKVENKKEAGIVPIKKQLHKLWAVVVAQLAEQWSVAQIRSSTILLTIKCTKTVL